MRRSRFRRRPQPRKYGPRINNQIRVAEVRVIDGDGTNLGVLKLQQALTRAHEQRLDLIEVAPEANPPVCRIANLGKWQYEQAKKARLERREGKHKQSETKGVRITMRASTHDLAFRAKQTDEFLKEGHKVHIELFMRGREKAHAKLGKERIEGFLGLLITPWRMEQEPSRGGKGMETMIVKEKKQPQKQTEDQTPNDQAPMTNKIKNPAE